MFKDGRIKILECFEFTVFGRTRDLCAKNLMRNFWKNIDKN